MKVRVSILISENSKQRKVIREKVAHYKTTDIHAPNKVPKYMS